MSEKKGGAYGNNSNDFRKKWDLEAYAQKAKDQDAASHAHAVEAQAAIAAGKKPPRPKRGEENMVKPTRNLEARKEDLEIDKNLGKTLVVDSSGKGPGAGFYCKMCNRTLKDSIAYLDHVNGRSHLARLGQTTQVVRSTLEQVRDRIAFLRQQTAQKVNSKNFDFDARMEVIKKEEEQKRQELKEKRKEAKKRKREGVAVEPEVQPVAGAREPKRQKGEGAKQAVTKVEAMQDDDAIAMMGFGSFGGGVKAKR